MTAWDFLDRNGFEVVVSILIIIAAIGNVIGGLRND